MTEVLTRPTSPFHRVHAGGASYWGPGDLYTWLVTGEESDGAYFAMHAVVPRVAASMRFGFANVPSPLP